MSDFLEKLKEGRDKNAYIRKQIEDLMVRATTDKEAFDILMKYKLPRVLLYINKVDDTLEPFLTKDEFGVGDEILDDEGVRYVVTRIGDQVCVVANKENTRYLSVDYCNSHTTGRHFKELEQLYKKLDLKEA